MAKQMPEGEGQQETPKITVSGPPWLRVAASVVTVVVALGGAFLGYLRLEEEITAQKHSDEVKAEISKQETDTKREIARIETDRKKLELDAQRSLRELELTDQSHSKADEADRAESARFSEILRNMFDSGHPSNDGVMAQLSQFSATPRFEMTVMRAVDARLRTARSAAEVALGYELLTDVGVPALETVAALNRNARVDFRRSLFSTFAKYELTVYPEGGREPNPPSTLRQLCFPQIYEFVRDSLPQNIRAYAAAVIQSELSRIFGGRVPAMTSDRPAPNIGPASPSYEGQVIRIADFRLAMARQSDSFNGSLALIADSLEGSERSISSILARARFRPDQDVDLHECFLPDVKWPKRTLPMIDFTTAFLDGADLRGSKLSSRTRQTLARAQLLRIVNPPLATITFVRPPEEASRLKFDGDFVQ
jgi:hypothetical protein